MWTLSADHFPLDTANFMADSDAIRVCSADNSDLSSSKALDDMIVVVRLSLYRFLPS